MINVKSKLSCNVSIIFAVVFSVFISTLPLYCADENDFLKICRNGTLEEVSRLIRSNPSLSMTKTQSGFTALMAAAESNPDHEVIYELIRNGADVNAEMFAGMTALIWASWKNTNPKVIEALIYSGADINVEAANGKRAADYAYMNENLAGLDIIRILETGIIPEKPKSLTREIKPSQIPESSSRQPRQTQQKAIPPRPKGPCMSDDEFLSLCSSGNPQAIWAAIKTENANPNAKDYYGTTAIMRAAENNTDINSIWWLYRAGADVNAKDDSGQTPLMYAAVSNNNPDIIKVLLKAGADVNAKDSSGRTALMLSSGKNANANVTAVLAGAKNVKINEQAARGWTALFWAAYSTQNPKIIDILLKSGANPKIRGTAGELAVDYAKRNKYLFGTATLKELEELSH